MNSDLKLRKLPRKEFEELSRILDKHDSWKKLFSIVPDDLNACNPQGCGKKYSKEDFEIVEKTAKAEHSSKSLILFDHWMYCGNNLPTLHHLKLLLLEAKLFRAADYVCVQLLHGALPKRPEKGPAKSIVLDAGVRIETEELENLLGELTYPSELITRNELVSHNININYTNTGCINVDKSLNLGPSVLPAVNRPTDIQLQQTQNLVNAAEDSNSYNFPVIDLNLEENSLYEEDNMDDIPNIPNLSNLQQSSAGTVYSREDYCSADQSISTNSAMTYSSVSLNNTSSTKNLFESNVRHFSYSDVVTSTNNFDESRLLGTGAFSKVYLGCNILDKPVAIKVPELDIKHEVEILSKCKHDNLVSLIGYSCDGIRQCLIYEYISGGTVRSKLQPSTDDKLNKTNKLLFWTDRLYIAMGTSRAVSYLHSKSIEHRDINTTNILLDNLNKPKLCDFGLVKLTSDPNEIVSGTSAYMPPEIRRGDVSEKWDTFSFGVVLLELLTSLPPMDEEQNIDLVTRFQESGIESLLDRKVGPWMANNVNFASEISSLATQCLAEKDTRPYMAEVTLRLETLIAST